MTDATPVKRGPGRPRKTPDSIAPQLEIKPARSQWVQGESDLKMLNLAAWQSARVVEYGGHYVIELLNQFPNGGGFTTARVNGHYDDVELAIKAMKDMVG